jgi:hypothetical protein
LDRLSAERKVVWMVARSVDTTAARRAERKVAHLVV